MERIKLQIQDKTTILAECLEISQYVQDINRFTHKRHYEACPYPEPTFDGEDDDKDYEAYQKIDDYRRLCPAYFWSYSTNHTVDAAPYYYILWRSYPGPSVIVNPEDHKLPQGEFCGHARLCDWRKVFNKMLAGKTLEEAWE